MAEIEMAAAKTSTCTKQTCGLCRRTRDDATAEQQRVRPHIWADPLAQHLLEDL
eukprot:CAMPEP_0115423260 /NCGR_PEP_ID=MMETSP0271-20121206/27213_1 /TAXON_ID=71861 /ORGANISM="Scrippsiella trochoidea, Strain CCMP3099" /LENGTH=53 /DNA_ID=CAMNT_0002848003 /DNA_START=173 /DNA_END=332 /DNA_ORIENTATION=+